MELGKAETFRALDDHDGSVGNIHADFDDRGGNQKLGFSRGKPPHLPVFVCGFQFAVYDAGFISPRQEIIIDLLIAGFQVAEIKPLGFGNQRIDNVSLPPFPEFPFHKAENVRAFLFVGMPRRDRFAPGRQFVYDGDVKVAI